MLKALGLLTGFALAIAAFGGCDDRDDAKRTEKTDTTNTAAMPAPARLGAGWHGTADMRQSAWAFTRAAAPDPLTGQSRPDALAGIRNALMANMLPARNNVRIEALVNRALSSIGPPAPDASPSRPMVVLATTPWNDDTMLLWIEVPGLSAPEKTAIGIEFDPGAVAAFRPLGDPAALPTLTQTPGRAAMLYEIQPQHSDKGPKSSTKYAVLHIADSTGDPNGVKLDRPITAADAMGTIDNAPEIVRFAAAAAGFGGLLRGDPAMRDLSCNDVIALAQSVRQPDTDGWRAQLIALMYRAQPLIDLPPADSLGK